jgi:hypothetical protein
MKKKLTFFLLLFQNNITTSTVTNCVAVILTTQLFNALAGEGDQGGRARSYQRWRQRWSPPLARFCSGGHKCHCINSDGSRNRHYSPCEDGLRALCNDAPEERSVPRNNDTAEARPAVVLHNNVSDDADSDFD